MNVKDTLRRDLRHTKHTTDHDVGRPPMCVMLHNSVRHFHPDVRQYVSWKDRASDLFDLELIIFSFCCSHKYVGSMRLMVPLQLRRDSPRAAAVSVQVRTALVSCWPSQWIRLHSEPCCRILIRRCSVPSSSASTTMCRSMRKGESDVERRVLGNLSSDALQASDVCSCCLRANEIYSLSDGRSASPPDMLWQVFLPVQVQFFVVEWRVRLAAAWTRLRARPLEAELCHCQFCVAWVCLPRQSSVAVRRTAVQHDCFVVVYKSRSGLLHEPVEILPTPSDDEVSRPIMSKSPVSCPNLLGQLLGQCLEQLSARGVPYMQLFRRQHRSMSRRMCGFHVCLGQRAYG